MMSMPRMRWLRPRLLLGGLVVCVGAASGGERPPVVGLPADFDAGARTEPYSGPHPSRLQRPAETFPFPIRLGGVGPGEPLFAGPRQYPFICDTNSSGLGLPLVDNQAGIGTPVNYDGDDPMLQEWGASGFSQDCLAPTRAWYFYKPKGEKHFLHWYDKVEDVDHITIDGVRVPFIVRVEMGTINRFIYIMAVLKGKNERPYAPSGDRWNRRLIYQFYGGVGIGHRQGKASVKQVLEDRREQLAQGYAVVASTGNTTANHFNIWLAEDTALRVKRQFVALYGEPEYTVGVGGSGGAIQQYLLAQNRPGLIDAAIAQYSYPDMITQTIPVFDCELLEHYFDVTDGANAVWRKAENRRWIEGFNASNEHEGSGGLKRIEFTTRVAFMARGEWLPEREGETECVVGWRGLTPLVLNPRFAHFERRLSAAVFGQVHWSYFEDLKHFFGTDEGGYARVPWDNVGVQYGLRALQRGQVSPEQFLRLNASVGSWKAPADMLPERYWLMEGAESTLGDFSPWSAHNMRVHREQGRPAPRFEGDRAAMAAAYRSGQVFLGRLDIPVVDVRHYLERQLDMHHVAGSFSARARMIAAQGDAANQAIWVSHRRYDPTPAAFAALDLWLRARKANPEKSWAETRPAAASDRCIDGDGRVMFQGERVWDSAWNLRAPGPCMRVYPIYSNPRMVAGDSIAGHRFKCALQPVADALDAGLYAPADMRPYRAQLEQVFPQGVCDYRQGDVAWPDDLFADEQSQ